MGRDWGAVFKTWSKGPAKTEQGRAENAERLIRDAIAANNSLKYRDFKVFTQGSYRNRVNVRQDSDVDIGVVCYDTFFYICSPQIESQLSSSIYPPTYNYAQFKDEVGAALIAKFGSRAVSRGKKSFDIKENTYRLDADVAVFFEYRSYQTLTNYFTGVIMQPDNLFERIINWPEQHYTNGVTKHSNTSRRFKKVVRILKKLANEMADLGYSSAKRTPGFLIECMVSNVPDVYFQGTSFVDVIREVLVILFNETRLDETCIDWREVSNLKYLFQDEQPWSRVQAHQFISDAWDYIGYE